MNLNALLDVLSNAPADVDLVFSFNGADIGKGYHVTEFKLSQTTGIDCGGRIDVWSEAAVQLLDGSGGEHMPVGKFVGILKQSVERVSGLGEAEASVEYSPQNIGLRIYDLQAPEISGDRVSINLFEKGAVCKPAQEIANCCAAPAQVAPATGCCGSTASQSAEPKKSGCC